MYEVWWCQTSSNEELGTVRLHGRKSKGNNITFEEAELTPWASSPHLPLPPQHSWWGLVYKQLGQLFFFRMWFIDCFVTMCMHMRLAAHTQSKHHGEFANLHTQFSDIISQQNTRRKSLQSPVWVIFQFFWCPIDWQTERCCFFVHVQVGWKNCQYTDKTV